MFKRNKGITLIALIITIIIMLILVAVSIDLIVDGKLFDSAGDAVSKTNEKVGQQQNRVDELMGELDYVESKQDGHDWQYTDNTLAQLKCTCGVCKRKNATGVTYNIGQQVKRTSSDTLLAEGETPTGKEWVVFGSEDCDKNGTNETLLITTLAPSTEELTLSGADAYNNGIAKIEAKVKEIYGTSARAMTIDDVNRTLGYTPTGGMYSKDWAYHVLDGFETTYKDYVVNIFGGVTAEEFDAAVVAGELVSPEAGKNVGDYKIDGYFYTIIDEGDGIPCVPATTSNVAKNLVFGTSDSPYVNWLASRGVYANDDYASFGLGNVIEGFASSCREFIPFWWEYPLRCVPGASRNSSKV